MIFWLFLSYIVLSVGFCTFQDLRHTKERKDLYNRIMSPDIHQYNNATKDKPRKQKPNNFLYESLKNAYRE